MISVIRKFGILLDKKQRRRIGVLFLIMLISTALEVLGVTLMVPLISAIMNETIIEDNAAVSTICKWFGIETHGGFVCFCLIFLILIFIFKDAFLIFQNYAQARFIANNRMAMQKKILNVIIRRPYDFFLNIKVGEVAQMVNRDPASAFGLLATLLSTLADTIVSLALGITVLVIEPVMTLLVIALILVTMIIITKVARPRIKDAGVDLRKSNSMAGSWVSQIVHGIKEIKVTKREDYFVNRYVEISKEGIRAEKIYKTLGGVPRALIEMVSICSALFALLLMLNGGRRLMDLLPSLSAFAVAAVKLLPCATKIASSMNEITYQQPYLDKLIENIQNLEYQGAIPAECISEEKDRIDLKKEITVKELTFSYPETEKVILDDAEIVIPIGKSVGLVGPSGAGKTTTVDIILGLLKPQNGLIVTDGKNVMDNYNDWLSHIGYIPQTIFLFDGSIRENVAFGIPADQIDDTKVWHAIKEAQLEEFVNSLPGGLDTKTGELGVRVSGGQKQRIGIARALYYDPELLVFDEATSSLDNETEAAIMDSINRLHGKKTMIIIAHRLQTIEGCDMVYRVDGGRITRER